MYCPPNELLLPAQGVAILRAPGTVLDIFAGENVVLSVRIEVNPQDLTQKGRPFMMRVY
jgi:hypothetical protein